ncbi:MAG: fibronectin type III domain-containing protein [Candidatus Peregrinibacteria bacterium]
MKKIFFAILSVSCAAAILSATALTALAADTTSPSDVENVVATPLDGAVSLSWDAATDDTGIEGYMVYYGTSSVTETGQTYDESVDAGNVLQYTVDGLDNGTEYYFSIIAYDAVGNESLSWAIEQSATPSEDAGTIEDTDAPQVSNAEALNKEEVKVVFSEAVVLPEQDPQDAFGIENDDTFEALAVLSAVMDETDETGKTVILTTDDQEEGVVYRLTVGIDVQDEAGNPIISGTSDTAIFTGSGAEKPVEDLGQPELVSVEEMDNTHILATFSETIVLSIDPSEDFEIVQENDPTKSLSILGVELGVSTDGIDDASAIITTSPQEDVSYILTASGVTDDAGNDVNPTKSSAVFQGIGSSGEPVDTTPPADVKELIAKYVESNGTYIITLSWDLLADNLNEVQKQILYMSANDANNYKKKSDLAADVDQYEISGAESGEYWLKLTQVDEAGNESIGTVLKVVLPETGPEILGLLIVSLGLGRVFSKRRKK